MIWGVTYQEMNGARAFLWTMSALTGAGLTNPVDGSFNLVVTAIYCLIGRPLHVYMTLLLSRRTLPGQLTMTHIAIWVAVGLAWFIGGVVFWYFMIARFNFIQALFYTAETGFLVGYKIDFFKPKHYNELIFTAFYILIGSTLISTGFVLMTQWLFVGVADIVSRGLEGSEVQRNVRYRVGSQRETEAECQEGEGGVFIMQNSSISDTEEDPQHICWEGSDNRSDDSLACKPNEFVWWCTGWRLPFISFVVLLYFGGQYALSVFNYTIPRSFLYSACTMTSTGVANPPLDDSSLVFTTIFLVVSIPLTTVSLGSVARIWIEFMDPKMCRHFNAMSVQNQQ